LEDFFRMRVLRASDCTVVPSRCSPANLAGNHKLLSCDSFKKVSAGLVPRNVFVSADRALLNKWPLEKAVNQWCRIRANRHYCPRELAPNQTNEFSEIYAWLTLRSLYSNSPFACSDLCPSWGSRLVAQESANIESIIYEVERWLETTIFGEPLILKHLFSLS